MLGQLRLWWRMVRRLHAEAARDNLGIVAAGVAFYAFLAIFPALAALMDVYGLVTDPTQAEQELSAVVDLIPEEVYTFLQSQMRAIAATSSKTLGLGFFGAILFALWSASKGTNAIITALNIAYRHPEGRGIVVRNAVALLITLGGVVTGVFALLLVAVVPGIMSFFDIPAQFGIVITLVRWILLAVMISLSIGLLYRFGPSTRLQGVPKRHGFTPGAVLATVLWLLTSAAFSWYASQFGNYNKTYGSVGAIVVLLLWFMLGAYALLLGAELDANISREEQPTEPPQPEQP